MPNFVTGALRAMPFVEPPGIEPTPVDEVVVVEEGVEVDCAADVTLLALELQEAMVRAESAQSATAVILAWIFIMGAPNEGLEPNHTKRSWEDPWKTLGELALECL